MDYALPKLAGSLQFLSFYVSTTDILATYGLLVVIGVAIGLFGSAMAMRTVLGDPYTPECAAAVIACDVVKSLDVGTHVIFVGELKDAEVLSSDEPMTYAYYHSVLKGKTPPKASSYVG